MASLTMVASTPSPSPALPSISDRIDIASSALGFPSSDPVSTSDVSGVQIAAQQLDSTDPPTPHHDLPCTPVDALPLESSATALSSPLPPSPSTLAEGIEPFDIDESTRETSSPLFPTPSSSFRPAPELNTVEDLTARLDRRIVSEKAGAASKRVSISESSSPVPGGSRKASIRRRSRSIRSTASPLASPSLAASERDTNPWAVRGQKTIEVIVRDFAFGREDPRFIGGGRPDSGVDQDVSKRRRSFLATESPLLGNDAFSGGGGGTFNWGFVTSHETDFPPENDDDFSSSQRYASEDDDGSLASSQSREVGFVRGIYVAIYDFVADSERELSMSAGDIVTVFSRQCAGWVQAGRITDGEVTDEIGLVPENYLELVERGEGDSGDEGSGWDEEQEGEDGEGARREEQMGGDRDDDDKAASPTTPHAELSGLHLTAAVPEHPV